VRQILTNIIGNAVKFTAEGHVLVRVTGVPDDATGLTAIHVAIEDTGIGIPEEKTEQIFSEFTQVDDERNRQFEGTGLGLAITKRLVEMMKGEIWVTSEIGVGSCFGFRVMLDTLEQAPEHPPAIPKTLQRVMIVDDNETNRGILSRQLELLGIAVDGYESAIEALEHLNEDYDLIISDHLMPGMDGAEFVTEKHARGNKTPTIIISSSPGSIGASEATDHIAALLQRPIFRSVLVKTLQDLGANLSNGPEMKTSEPPCSDASGTAVQDPESTGSESIPGLRKMRILAAEDNKTNQFVLRKMLKHLDIDLQFANDGHEAVAAYQAFAPDLIFMDISMPGMDGKEATRTIRNIEKETGLHVPIVALTAHAMTGDSESILQAGLDHYLTKPLRKPKLQDVILKYVPDAAVPVFPEEELAS